VAKRVDTADEFLICSKAKVKAKPLIFLVTFVTFYKQRVLWLFAALELVEALGLWVKVEGFKG